MSSSITILHNPRGVEHPYEALPLERQPRDPVAGDAILVGAQTSPAGTLAALWLMIAVNDEAEKRIAAQLLASNSTVDTWQAVIPPLAAGDRVCYRFTDDSGEIETETFHFVVAGWRRAGALQQWRVGDDWLQLQIEPEFTVTLRFVQPDQIDIRYAVGSNRVAPASSELPITSATNFTLTEEADRLTVGWHGVQLVVQRSPNRLSIYALDGSPLFSEPESEGMRWLVRDGAVLRFAQSWQTPTDERFFGFGERFNALDQRSQQIDTLVYEQYKNQDRRTYLPVPFFISSKGYALWLNTHHRAHFDLAATQAEVASFVVEHDTLDLTLFLGQPKQVLSAFTGRVGRAALPPQWAFGLWMSSNEWNSQAQVLEQVALTQHHGIPATVLVIEAWSDEATFYIFNDAQYTPRADDGTFRLSDFTFPAEGRWPDPKGMVDSLHAQGIHLLLWQIPVFKQLDAPHAQHDLDVAAVLQQGWVIQEADGSAHRIRPLWFRDGYVPDFGNPALEAWWFARRRYLIDELGVDGFKTDGGEHLWGEGLRAWDGQHRSNLLNRFPLLYQAAYARFAGSQRILFSRAGYTGAQAVSTHWAGDENSTFAAFRASITAGLSAGMSGFAFWGWDIGGFGGGIPTAELYLRATAMATFCPIMQYHSEYNPERIECRDRTPWNVQAHTGNPEIIPIFRFFANLRMTLLPYIWNEARKASESGLPLMRALALEFPHDQKAAEFPYQYLFGDDLLVAPVVWEGCDAIDVYLPVGEWRDFWTNEHFHGSQVIQVATPLNRIPVFVRGDSAVTFNPPIDDLSKRPQLDG